MEGGLAQLARAPALQAGGHRFDSDILHFWKENNDKAGSMTEAAQAAEVSEKTQSRKLKSQSE